MRPNSSQTGKRRRNRTRPDRAPPALEQDLRDDLCARVGHRFRDPSLVDRAMTHRSAATSNMAAWSNERLEFLGDRVLSLVIAEALLRKFPADREGALAPRLNALVNRDACAAVGVALGLPEFLMIDDAERSTGGAAKPTLVADAVEALIGAIYLDGGMAAAEGFIERSWKSAIKDVGEPPKDPKTRLQELSQGKGQPTPRYIDSGRSGPDHAPIFTSRAEVEGVASALGSGASKQDAERAAARALLELLEMRNPT